jgi:hypothetical protein
MTPAPTSEQATPEKQTPFPDFESSQEKEKAESHGRKKPVGAHRRTVSGNIFSKLTFLRTASDPGRYDGADDDLTSGSGTAMASVQHKSRKRKGSLRKTVLGKGRDRKSSDTTKTRSPLSSKSTTDESEKSFLAAHLVSDNDMTPRPSSDLSSPVLPESPPRWPFRKLSKSSIPSIRSSVASVDPASSAASIISPTNQTDASTTDDDELISPHMPAAIPRKVPGPPSSSGDSYFPPQPSMVRRISHMRSPLATAPQSASASPALDDEEWDYSETAFWGYVILIVTWIVFVVGMGSCFGVWSWAWDVGETPKAPPELEDDPTLPIVGYYPALLVLTGVMAWVWVVVAWVGMKYFRHADFRGDDG